MFERCLYFNVNALARQVNTIWDEAFAEFDLSPAHAYLLRLVLAQPGIAQRDIALELKLAKSTVTRFIDTLQTKGLLSRKKTADGDPREQNIFPTAKTLKIADKLNNKGEELYKKMLATLGTHDMKTLVEMLRSATQHLG
ncbi:MAG: MarR family transcriptional regulator [Gammaproteobacteria bacterium]|jgi:DNA-binding MarR family transcriptional regulator|nr:MarR family transcriptional regulator [Gammaproteobacteria bacterium]